MKAARFFAVLLGIVGLVLMLGTAALCFSSLNAQVQLKDIPQEAQDCAEGLARALDAGDLTAVEALLYGQPDLDVDRGLTGETAAVWEIFRTGISCELTSDYYVDGSDISVDAVITVPDITSITDSLNDHALVLMNERIAAATEMAELYDEENNFRQELVEEVLAGAVEVTFAEEPELLTYETTWILVSQDGQWWILPDQALLTALTGGVA